MAKVLHIVSFDIPYPANYGGVIDVYYKLKALHQLGVQIILHCFQYGDRKPQKQLEAYCSNVYYYPRHGFWSVFHPYIPYIIASRRPNELLARLLDDDFPILFEGLHCTYYASHPLLKGRLKLLRAHNIESEYYRGLAKQALRFDEKVYYRFEAWKLKRFESRLTGIDHVLPISHRDHDALKAFYPAIPSTLLHPFHGNEELDILPGTGTYCLYHGNLGVEENVRAVEYLAREVFKDQAIQLVIAGRQPSERILKLSSDFVRIVANPDDVVLRDLIRNAQVNVLPALLSSGIKLKLLSALFLGRHCVTNTMDTDPALRQLIHQEQSSKMFLEKVRDLMVLPFTRDDIERRRTCLRAYHNQDNAKTLVNLL